MVMMWVKLLRMETYYTKEGGGALPEWLGGRFEERKKASKLVKGLPRTGEVRCHELWSRTGGEKSGYELSDLCSTVEK